MADKYHLPLPRFLKADLDCELPLPQFDADGLFKSYLPTPHFAPKKPEAVSASLKDFDTYTFQSQMQVDPVLQMFYQKAKEMEQAAGPAPSIKQ
jgi:hypothetical protein